MANEDTEISEDNKKKEEGGLKTILLVIIIFLMILVLSGVGFIGYKLISMDSPEAGTSEETGAQNLDTPKNIISEGILIETDNLTVNLQDEDDKFLRVKMEIEVVNNNAKEKYTKAKGKVKDLIITILSSKFYKEVKTPEGKFKLKRELIFRLNKLLGGQPVKAVFFSDFVSQ